MKAIQIKEYVTSVNQLEITNLSQPTLTGPNQVIVQVEAAAANFFDILQVKGKYQTQPPFPWIAGLEFSGTIIESNSDNYQVGERVFGASQGAYAEFIKVDVSTNALIPIPDFLSFEEACTLFITAPTCYLSLFDRGNIQRGETVLVHAGAGGVGLMAIQMAKSAGCFVIATASTEEKLKICKEYGADVAINYKTSDWIAEVKKVTGKKGCDVVFDPVGLVDQSLKVVGWNSRILIIGFAAGEIEKVAMNKLLLKSCSLVGCFWGGNVLNKPNSVPRIWQAIIDMLIQRTLRPVVYSKLYDGLDQVPGALEALGQRETWGKVVIKIKPTSAKV